MIQHVAFIAEDSTCYNYTSLQQNLNSIYTSLLKDFVGKIEEEHLKAEKEYIDEKFYEGSYRNINVSHFEFCILLFGWVALMFLDVPADPGRNRY